MLMQHAGSIEHFDYNGPNTLDQWVQRFEIYCDANNIVPEPRTPDGRYLFQPNRRRNLFLTSIGPRAFAIVQAAVLPSNPQNCAIPMLVESLQQLYQPVGLVEANRFQFHQRLQQPNESVLEYISVHRQ